MAACFMQAQARAASTEQRAADAEARVAHLEALLRRAGSLKAAMGIKARSFRRRRRTEDIMTRIAAAA